jgi:hypothetical protein
MRDCKLTLSCAGFTTFANPKAESAIHCAGQCKIHEVNI